LTDLLLCVLLLFISADAQAPAPTTDPDPPRASTDTPAASPASFSLVRKLIDYGKQLAGTVQHRAATPAFALFAKPFGTTDLARITAGLRRAAALCHRAARGQDLMPSSIRMSDIRGPRPARLVAPPDPQPEPEPADHTEDPRFARLPTEAEIAAEVRRRPVGAVIADICRDLGIAPGQLDRAFWDELSHAIIAYGGNLASFLGNLHTRLIAFNSDDHADRADPLWPAPPPRLPSHATGPP
jgi:hypothetical protein